MTFPRLAAAAALLFVPLAAQADPRQDLVDGMAKCAVVNDSVDRLSCYDALYPQLKAARDEAPQAATAAPPPSVAVLPPASAPVAPPAAPAAPLAAAPAPPPPPVADDRPWYDPGRMLGVSPREQTTPEQFGGENLMPPKPPPGQVAVNQPPRELDSITASVRDWSFNSHNKFIVVLDNGQIWQQIESDAGRAHFMKNAKNSVTISRGFIGSYDLVVNDASVLYKVRRLK